MAQLDSKVLQDVRFYHIHHSPHDDVESIHSNDANSSFISSEYQKVLLSEYSNSAKDLHAQNVDQFMNISAFKCPQNHSMLTYPKGVGKCAKCNIELSMHPCRHCNVCDYDICLQCYTASPSNCIGNHGLIAYLPELQHEFFCDVCGSSIIENDNIHSCRKCDYDVCSKCYVPRTVLNNIDLNDIPLKPYKYDIIFANNGNNIDEFDADDDDDDDDRSNNDERKIHAMEFLKFGSEFVKDIDIHYNVNKEEEYIEQIISEIDKIRDDITDLKQEIKKKKYTISKLRRVELFKRTQLNSVQIWMKKNKLKWESFKLQWKEWNLECFIEFLKRVKLECSSFGKYYSGNDINCKLKIEKYMDSHIEKFGNNIFLGKSHLRLFNELSLYRIGIINDKDCSIIYAEIHKIVRFDKKHRKKKSSKKKKKSQRNRMHLDDDMNVQDLSSFDELTDDNKEDEEHDQLLLFLRGIKLDMYYHRLVNDGFDDINALSILDRTDLVRIGMRNGHIKKLLKSIDVFNSKEQEDGEVEIEGQIKQHYYISPQ